MLLLSVLLGLAAAAALAVAAVLQQSAAADVPVHSGCSAPVRVVLFLRGLLARPRWLLGQLVGAVGMATFATALHLGQVVVVQPLLATQLVFSLLVVGALRRRRSGSTGVGPRQWGSAALVVGGLAVFLLGARPAVGTTTDQLLLAFAVVAALLAAAAAVVVSSRVSAQRRPLLLALAAGAGFGVDALLIKEVTTQVAAGHLLTWPAAALAVLATCSVVLAQRAFQSGSVAGVLPAITTLEPVVAIALAGPVFGESLAAGSLDRLAQGAGLLTLAFGVMALARAEAKSGARSEAQPMLSDRVEPAGTPVTAVSHDQRHLVPAGGLR